MVPEEVPFARPGARFTRAFEDTAAYLAKNAPKPVVASMMRVDWATVGRIIERVLDEALGPGAGFLDGLRRIGIDEVSYPKGHRYLLVVTDHDTGRIVFAHPGRSGATLEVFFAALGPERAALLEAVSVDLYGAWPPVIARRAPQAQICADPFHVLKQVGDALDELRRADWQELRRTDPEAAKHFKGLRVILRRRADGLAEDERSLLEGLEATNARVFQGWLLADQLRGVYRAPDPEAAEELLDAWVYAAATSGLSPFVKAAVTLEAHSARILNAIRLGINNARIEAMNSTTRLLSHRSRGFRRVDSLIALIHLVSGRVPVKLPT